MSDLDLAGSAPPHCKGCVHHLPTVLGLWHVPLCACPSLPRSVVNGEMVAMRSDAVRDDEDLCGLAATWRQEAIEERSQPRTSTERKAPLQSSISSAARSIGERLAAWLCRHVRQAFATPDRRKSSDEAVECASQIPVGPSAANAAPTALLPPRSQATPTQPPAGQSAVRPSGRSDPADLPAQSTLQSPKKSQGESNPNTAGGGWQGDAVRRRQGLPESDHHCSSLPTSQKNRSVDGSGDAS